MPSKHENPVLIAALGAAGLLLNHYRSLPQETAAAGEPHAFRRRETDAIKPADEPKSGWWETLKRVAHEISANQLMTQAAAVTFYGLLSVFPALAAMVSIYGLIADPATIVKQVDALSAVMPGGGQELLSEQLKALTSASNKGLGWGLVLGVATSLWTSNQAMKAVFNALNAVHETQEVRGFIKLTAMTLACTLGLILFMVVALAAVVVLPAVLGVVGLGGVTDMLVSVLRWPLLLACVGLLLAVIYRFGPCRTKVVWRWVSWGSAVAAVLWLVVSFLFSYYVANFGNYNKTYGSLGAVVGFMTWIWISTTMVLIGAQLDAELEKSTDGKQKVRASSDAEPEVRGAPAPA